MKKRTALGLAVSMATSYPVTLNALGLGELQSSSQLNQPLNAQIELLSTGEKEVGQLRVRLASADVFDRVGIDRPAYLNSLKFRTTTRNGKPIILVSSDQPVKEPFLNFLLEVSWPQGQLLKEYTVLLDPPVLIQTGGVTSQNTAAVRAEPKASGVVNRADINEQQQSTQQIRPEKRPPVSSTQESVLAAQARIAEQEEKQKQRVNRSATKTSIVSGGKKYRVRSGDTMQKVTSRLRYPGTTNSQMMLALFKANPHAFAKNNINYLKKGEVLTQPPRSAVFSTSKSAARAQIKQHYAAWKQYRKGLAAKPVVQTQVQANASSKKSGTENTAGSSQNNSDIREITTESAKAKLSVVGSKAESTDTTEVSTSGNTELQKKLALVEEALASTSSKNVELEARVGKLEAIVRKKDRLITLKNERLARLESQLANADAANIKQPNVSEAEDLATSVGNEADQKNNVIIRGDETKNTPEVLASLGNSNQSPEAVTSAPIINNEKVVDNSNTIDDNTKKSTASPFVADNNNVEEGGLLDLLKSPLVATIGGGSLLALILGGLFLRRRQVATADVVNDNEFIEEVDSTATSDNFDLRDETFDTNFDSKFKNDHTAYSSSHDEAQKQKYGSELVREESVEEDELDKVLSADSSLDEDEVLQEADVYIVYGLHEQAEEELKKAIEEKPSKLEYRYKLLENYQIADDSKAFVASAKDFLKAEGDNKQELWEKVIELGKKITPENDMFAEKSSTKAATVFAGVVAAGATAAALATSDEIIKDDVAVDNTETISNDEFESLLNTDTDLGFDDLDLGLDASDGNDNTEFDLSTENSVLDSMVSGDEIPKGDLDLSEFSDLNANDEEFNFEGLDSLEGLGGLDDFEPDNSNVLSFKDAEPTIADDSASLKLELDSSTGLDKVLPTGSYSSSFIEDDNDALSFLNLPDDDQEMQDAHIGTKLDLARAYLDMGDVEGARCTLEEVVVEGNEAQKREAEEMLQQTG